MTTSVKPGKIARQRGLNSRRRGHASQKDCHRRARLEPLESRHLLSVASWGTTLGGIYDDYMVDAAYGEDGSLYALSRIQTAEDGRHDLRLEKYAAGGQEVFSQPILHSTSPHIGHMAHMLVSTSGDIYVAGVYRDGADSNPSIPGGELPVYGENDIFFAHYSVATGSPERVWMESFGSAERDELAAIQLVENGSAEPDVCLVGNFGQTLTLWDGSELPNTSGTDDGTFVVRATANGELQYANELHGSGEVSLRSATVTSSGELYVTGSFRGRNVQIGNDSLSSHQRISQPLVAKYSLGDTAVQPLWAHRLATIDAQSSWGRAIAPGSNGTVFVAGSYQQFKPTDLADFGITELPFAGYGSRNDDGFIVQVAEIEVGQPENVWVRHLPAVGELLPDDLNFSGNRLVVASSFNWDADFDPGTGTHGDLVARGYADLAVAEILVEMDEAGRVIGDTLGRIWQMETGDDDLPAAGGYPRSVRIDLSPNGRLAIPTYTNSSIPLTPVGTLQANGGFDGVLLDIAPDYPAVEMTIAEPVVGESESHLTAAALYPRINTDLEWQWELWRLDGTARTLVQNDNNNADPTTLTFVNPLDLDAQYEAVVTVTETATGKVTEYPFRFHVTLDPPQNLTGEIVSNDTVTLTWDLPDSLDAGDRFVIEADCPLFLPYWEIVGDVSVGEDDLSAGQMSATVGMGPHMDKNTAEQHYRVRSYRGTPDAMELLSPEARVVINPYNAETSNAPPVADAGGPYEVGEGQSVNLDASGTTDPDLPDDTLTFAWDYDNDGAYDDATGVAPVFDAASLQAGTTITVGLLVTDSEGNTDMDSASISVLATSTTVTYVNSESVEIPDQGSVPSIIYVPEDYTIAELTVAIAITHQRPSDLTVTLTSPMGTVIELPLNGGNGERFVDENVNGTWTLEVADGKKRKVGTLNSWSMTVTPAAAGGGSSYALPPIAAVSPPTDTTNGIASLRKVESPRVRSTEGPISNDRLDLLLRSEKQIQEQSTALDRRGLVNGHDLHSAAIDLALTELEESLLDGHLAQLLAANWIKKL